MDEEMSNAETDDNMDAVNVRNCQCAEILASVFPQLVDHWRASGNKIKTIRYLTESGAAALTTSANMQALSHLYEVKGMFGEKTEDGDDIATEEDMARVENLIGQVLVLISHITRSKKSVTRDKGLSCQVTARGRNHETLIAFKLEGTDTQKNDFRVQIENHFHRHFSDFFLHSRICCS
jgi:hypothetical protein